MKPEVDKSSFIADTAVIIGDVTIGNYTEISSFSVIYGCANFRVGNKCYVGPQTWINVSEDVVMGNGVGIGPRTMIFTHGSFLPYTEGYPVRFATA